MRNKLNKGLEIEIDKITNSVENAVAGDSFQTEVSILNKLDFKNLSTRNFGHSIGKLK